MQPTLVALIAAVTALAGCSAHGVTRRDGELEFFLRAPQARSVVLVTAGEAFVAVPAVRRGLGTWTASLTRTGEFKYFYLVDGKVYLPDCGFRERDDFGEENCVFAP